MVMHVGCGQLPATFVFCAQTNKVLWVPRRPLRQVGSFPAQFVPRACTTFCGYKGPLLPGAWSGVGDLNSCPAAACMRLCCCCGVVSSAAGTLHHYGVYDARVRGMECKLMTNTFGMHTLHDMRTELHTGTAECIAPLLQDASVVGGWLVATCDLGSLRFGGAGS